MKIEFGRRSHGGEKKAVSSGVKSYTKGGAEFGIHLADSGLLPELPPLDTYIAEGVVKVDHLLRRNRPSLKTTYPWAYEDIEVEVVVETGDVALIGSLADERYHLDPETLMPISEGHQRSEFPDVRALSVTELALGKELDGDRIEQVAHYLLGQEENTVQWAPRTAYRKEAPKPYTQTQKELEVVTKPTYAELTPEEKRDYLVDAMGAIASTNFGEDGVAAHIGEVNDVLGLVIANLDLELLYLDPARLTEGADRADETTWEYVEKAFEGVEILMSQENLWEAKGLEQPNQPNIELAKNVLPRIKELSLKQRVQRMAAQDINKFRIE